MIKKTLLLAYSVTSLLSVCLCDTETRSGSYNLTVVGGALIDNLTVSNSSILNSLSISSTTTCGGSLDVAGNVAINTDKFTVNAATGNVAVAGNLDVAGTSTINNSMVVIGSVTADDVIVSNGMSADSLAITTFMTIGENFNVDGMATFSSAQASDSLSVGSLLTVAGDTILQGGLDVAGTTTLNNVDIENNTIINGTLYVAGDATLHGKVFIAPPTRLSLTNQVTTILNPSSLAFSPQGNFLALTDTEFEKSLKIFSVNSGMLSTTATSSTNAGQSSFVSWAPTWSATSGGFVATANVGTIMIFNVDTLGNVSANPSSVQFLNSPASIAWAPTWSTTTGGFIASIDAEVIHIFGVDTNGLLTEISSRNTTTPLETIVWSPNWSISTGGFIAVINSSDYSLHIYSVDTSGHILSETNSYPTAWGTSMISFSPEGDFIATASPCCNFMQIFSINSSGNISSITNSQHLGFSPQSIAWSPIWSSETGGFVAVSSTMCNMIDIFNVEATGNISLSKIGFAFTGSNPSTAWSPDGAYIAAANYYSNTLQTFSVNL